MTATELPRWDVSSYFPSLESREFIAAEERAAANVDRLGSLYDRHNVRGGEQVINDDTAAIVDEVLLETNRVSQDLDQIEAYTYSFVSTDTTNATAQATFSRLQEVASTLSDLRSRLDAWR